MWYIYQVKVNSYLQFEANVFWITVSNVVVVAQKQSQHETVKETDFFWQGGTLHRSNFSQVKLFFLY